MNVHVTGAAWGFVWMVGVDMGGEAVELVDLMVDYYARECRIGWSYAADHEFFCPGTYEITVFDADYPNVRNTTTVTVSPPSMPYLFVFEAESAYDVYVATHVPIADRPFAFATVDWGDGSSETFTWTRRGLYVGTPDHHYAADGEYTARVTHHYRGRYCSFTQSMSAAVKIPNPGNPTHSATWGRVKALYR